MELSPLKWLIDVFLKVDSRLIENKETRFREYFESVYHSLLELHRDHLKMLESCESQLPYNRALDDGKCEWRSGERLELISEEDIPQEVEKVKRKWKTLRQELGADRVELRAKSKAIISQIEDQRERRFIFSVIYYFLHPGRRTAGCDISLDSHIEELIKYGHDVTIDSPSLTVLEKIADVQAPDQLRKIFKEEQDNLLKRWSEVSERYHELYVFHVQSRS